MADCCPRATQQSRLARAAAEPAAHPAAEPAAHPAAARSALKAVFPRPLGDCGPTGLPTSPRHLEVGA